MKVKKRVQCEAEWTEGPFAGTRCLERRNLVKCENILENGCAGYFCTLFHWSEHWDYHEAEKT